MTVTTSELALADQAAKALLEQLGLSAYLYEIEPRDDAWMLRLDCAVPEGWQSTTLELDKRKLLTSLYDGAVRSELLETWRNRLSACKVG